jgi:dihydroxy-acid dehydratase
MIVLDVPGRRLDLDVPEDELLQRRPSEAAEASYTKPLRGWQRLYVDHVMQADKGADLDFLVGSSGDQVTRDSH